MYKLPHQSPRGTIFRIFPKSSSLKAGNKCKSKWIPLRLLFPYWSSGALSAHCATFCDVCWIFSVAASATIIMVLPIESSVVAEVTPPLWRRHHNDIVKTIIHHPTILPTMPVSMATMRPRTQAMETTVLVATCCGDCVALNGAVGIAKMSIVVISVAVCVSMKCAVHVKNQTTIWSWLYDRICRAAKQRPSSNRTYRMRNIWTRQFPPFQFQNSYKCSLKINRIVQYYLFFEKQWLHTVVIISLGENKRKTTFQHSSHTKPAAAAVVLLCHDCWRCELSSSCIY